VTLLSRAAAAAALSLVLTGPALTAHAATTDRGNSWRALVTFDGGRVQACKVPTTATGPWKVKLRLNGSGAGQRLRASATVLKGTHATAQVWSSGWVAKGDVSPIGTVRLTRGSAYSLDVSLSASQAGTGASVTAGQLHAC
jgi:hypothetical protein